MSAIKIDVMFIIVSIIIALIPEDNDFLFWASWSAVVAWILFLCVDIYRYRQPKV